jgi:glycosyltransferase involved in cell wall biosynthesis
MRVAYLGEAARHPLHGVGETTVQLARGLLQTREGNELVLVVNDPQTWMQHALTTQTIELPPIARRRRAVRIAWQQLILPGRLRSADVDLLHGPAYVLPLRSRLPSVVTIHDIIALTHPELCRPETRMHHGLLMPHSIRRARKVIVPSHVVKEQLSSRLGVPESKITVIAPGLDDRFIITPRPEALEAVSTRFKLPSEFVLVPGRLEPKKNLARLVEAFQVAKRAGLTGELVLIGGPGWGVRMRELVATAGVRWLGYVSEADRPLLYRLASEIAYPSLAEGFGLPVIEALASGRPVVCSDVPAVREIATDAAILIDPLSTSSIAAALLRTRTMGTANPSVTRAVKICAQFSWRSAAERTWQTYREAMG